MITYDLHPDVLAFTAGKDCHGTESGIDAREVGVWWQPPQPLGGSEQTENILTARQPAYSPSGIEGVALFIPRQTHSVNVVWAEGPGEAPDSDAVITRVPGLCVAVKTADCIPVLLYDERQHLVAAVHAGWRGTVGRIVQLTIRQMQSRGEDLHAVIGPGISLASFEVGDEVYEAFLQAGFPMERIAKRMPSNALLGTEGRVLSASYSCDATLRVSRCEGSKWHIDLWEANRWLLEQCGATDIRVDGTCTMLSPDFYSARRETIKTGRNINGILLRR